jgi:CPA2 family monovalent cation:H+ antiporter-2
LFLVSVVAIGVGVGYATQMMGLSFALGAFIAGLILSESEFSHQALNDVVPVRDVFGLLFFVSVGMLIDPGYALNHPGRVGAAVLMIFLGKAVILGLLTRVFGYVNMAPWIVALGLSQVGEFSFVLARMGVSSGQLSKGSYDLALTCTVLTMAFSPIVSRMALPLGRAVRARQKTAPVTAPMEVPKNVPERHLIVGGYGRSGKAAARVLQSAGVPLVVVELDYSLYGDVGRDGHNGVWGDITSEEVLHGAHAQNARILLITIPDPATIRLCVERARHLNPQIVVIARAVREHHVAELHRLGVEVAVQPEFEGGVEMVRQALVRCQCSSETTADLLAGVRKEYYGGAVG